MRLLRSEPELVRHVRRRRLHCHRGVLRVRRGLLDGVSNVTADGPNPFPHRGESFYSIAVNLRQHSYYE